jgi:hypothetical protein
MQTDDKHHAKRERNSIPEQERNNMRERRVLMIEECAYGELAMEVAVKVLEACDIRLSGKVEDDFSAFSAEIKVVAARLAAKHHNRDYESERVTGYAHGILLQPQNTVNDLDDEIEWKTMAAETLQRYADKRHKSRQEDE